MTVPVTDWPLNPSLYEINTWAWLDDLSRRAHRPVTLADVPPAEWDALAETRFDAVWLMGVWERSPAGARIARAHPGLQEDTAAPCPTSPRRTWSARPTASTATAPPRAGRPGGPGKPPARPSPRAECGWCWTSCPITWRPITPGSPAPGVFIQGTTRTSPRSRALSSSQRARARPRPRSLFPRLDGYRAARRLQPGPARRRDRHAGRHRRPVRRRALRHGDAARPAIFAQTWGANRGGPPSRFLADVIPAVKARTRSSCSWPRPTGTWSGTCSSRASTTATTSGCTTAWSTPAAGRARSPARRVGLPGRLVRFIENHDEPRAAATFGRRQERGRRPADRHPARRAPVPRRPVRGRQRRLPVQLGRRAAEPIDSDLRAFYRTLLQAIAEPVFHDGAWALCETTGWPDNPSWTNLVAGCWQLGEERRLIVVNLSDGAAQARVRLPWADLQGHMWRLSDPFNGDTFIRYGSELVEAGPVRRPGGLRHPLPPRGAGCRDRACPIRHAGSN